MWRGVITERLVMETDGEELELVPIYSDSDPDVQGIYDAVNAVRAAAESRKAAERREREAARATEARAAADPVWAVFEVSADCPSCTTPVPLNGPCGEVECPACGGDIPIPPGLWSDVLEDVGEELRDMEQMEASKSRIMASLDFDLMYGRLAPSCPSCGSYLEGIGGPGSDKCPECGARLELSPAPDWLSNALEGADVVAGPFPRDGEAAERPAPESVRYNCPKCGAWHTIDGSERICECDHCGLIYTLPDDLWARFHPAPVKQRWFVRLVEED
jgi:rubrerythrin